MPNIPNTSEFNYQSNKLNIDRNFKNKTFLPKTVSFVPAPKYAGLALAQYTCANRFLRDF